MDDSNEKSSPSTSNIVPSSHNSIKSISLNIISNNSCNLNEGRIIENNNDKSFCDNDLNKKIKQKKTKKNLIHILQIVY